MVKIASANLWVPDRQDIIWIDCNPQAGQEMCDIDPLLVLFPRIFNDKTSLSICLPMTTPEYNADNPFAAAAGKTTKRKIEQISYVLYHQPRSFDWRVHSAKPHPLGKLGDS